MRILVIDDDLVIGWCVQQVLRDAGKSCLWVRDGAEALKLAREERFGAIILDIMLPSENGLQIVRTLRAEGVKIPILVISALGTVEDRVAGLSAGADDYLVKPFAFAELLARLDAVCRRTTETGASCLEAGDLRLDLESRTVYHGDVPIELTPTQFSLLEFLMRYSGQVVTRKMLCEHLWQTDWDGTSNVIDVHVKHLRTKISGATENPVIQTVRGRGYSLLAT